MWEGFSSVEPDLIGELVQEKISGPLCLLGFVNTQAAPRIRASNGKIIGAYRLYSPDGGEPAKRWRQAVIFRFPNLRRLIDEVLGPAHTQSEKQGFWLLCRITDQKPSFFQRYLLKLQSLWLDKEPTSNLNQSLPFTLNPLDAKDVGKQPLFIMDFLQFRLEASSIDGGFHQSTAYQSGTKAYREYIAYMKRYWSLIGATPILVMRPLKVLSNQEPVANLSWSELSLMRFPNIQSISRLLSLKAVQRALPLKNAALENYLTYCLR